MSSSLESQSKTETLFDLDQSSKTIPAFGLHPWFTASVSTTGQLDKRIHYRNVLKSSSTSSPQTDRTQKKKTRDHQACKISSENQEKEQEERDRSVEDWIENHLDLLPAPIGLDRFLSDLKSRLIKYPNSIVGEIGLDKAFKFQVKVPSSSSPSLSQRGRQEGGAEVLGLMSGTADQDRGGRLLVVQTNFKISIDHQSIILKSQIEVAIELSRSISLHCVQASNELIELIEGLIDQCGTSFTGPIVIKSKRQQRRKKDQEDRSIPTDPLHHHHLEESRPSHPSIDQTFPPQDQHSYHHHHRLPPSPRRGGGGEGIKICWHSANISTEVLQRVRSLLPNTIYFSYSNDLSILSRARKQRLKNDDDDDHLGLGLSEDPPSSSSSLLRVIEEVSVEDYSNRVAQMIRVTPIDRLLIESDDGSQPISIDQKLLKILMLIYLLKYPPDPPHPPARSHRLPQYHSYSFSATFQSLVDQIQANWNAFHSSPTLPVPP